VYEVLSRGEVSQKVIWGRILQLSAYVLTRTFPSAQTSSFIHTKGLPRMFLARSFLKGHVLNKTWSMSLVGTHDIFICQFRPPLPNRSNCVSLFSCLNTSNIPGSCKSTSATYCSSFHVCLSSIIKSTYSPRQVVLGFKPHYWPDGHKEFELAV
jgi:hypothetical protein